MKRIFTLSILTILSLSAVYAQNNLTYAWAHSPFDANGKTMSIKVSDKNDIYYGGYYYGGNPCDLNPTAGSNIFTDEGPFLAKLDSNENYVWGSVLYCLGALFTINDIAVDTSDNVYVIGTFQDATVDFDPGPTTTNIYSGSTSTIFIAKYDAAGSFQWAYKIGGSGVEKGYAVEVDNAQNIYFAGSLGSANVDVNPGTAVKILSTAGQEDIMVLKFKPNGQFVWGFNLGKNDNDYCTDILCDNNANIYLTGRVSAITNFDFNPSATVSNVGCFVDDAFIAKYDSSGAYIFAHTIGGGAGEEVGNALEFYNNTITVAGNSINTGPNIFLDANNTMTLPNAGFTIDNDVFLYRFSTNGNYIDGLGIGGAGTEYVNDFTIDNAGNFILTGYHGDSNDFDPTVGVFSLPITLGDYNNFIASYSGSFAYRYAIQFGSNNNDASNTIAQTNNGNIYVGGYLGNTDNDFDPTIVVQGVQPHSQVTFGFFMAKYIPCNAPPVQPSAIIGTNSFCFNTNQLTFSLNPITSVSSYTWSFPSAWTGSSISDSIIINLSNLSGTISVTANNGCGSSLSQALAITANPLPTVSITTSDSILCIGQNATLTANGANTYSWNTGNTGSTEIVSPISNTNYTVIGIDANGCENTSSFTQFVTACVGINETNKAITNLMVFPNPFNDFLVVNLNTLEYTEITIMNSLNQLVHSENLQQNQTLISTQHWAKGIYFVMFKNNTGSKTMKLVK
jgi:hypothetical protein